MKSFETSMEEHPRDQHCNATPQLLYEEAQFLYTPPCLSTKMLYRLLCYVCIRRLRVSRVVFYGLLCSVARKQKQKQIPQRSSAIQPAAASRRSLSVIKCEVNIVVQLFPTFSKLPTISKVYYTHSSFGKCTFLRSEFMETENLSE